MVYIINDSTLELYMSNSVEYDMDSDDHKEFVKNIDHSKLATNKKLIDEHDNGNPRLTISKSLPSIKTKRTTRGNRTGIRSHPFFKNRINKYMNNLEEFDKVKTWVDMETTEPNQNMIVEPIRSSLASSHNRNTNLYTGASEKELEGLYCEDPIYLYLNPNNQDQFISCHNIVWNCNKCDMCLKRRRLERMNKMIDRFDHHSDIDRSNLYHLIIRDFSEQEQSSSKITKRLKYLGIDNMLMYSIDEKEDTITYLMEGDSSLKYYFSYAHTNVKVSFDYAINHIGINDKYSFLGKFHKAVPSVSIKGMTQEELDELEEQVHFKDEYCKCGELWEDHTFRKTSPAILIDSVIPHDHYEKGHKIFIRDHFGIT